jgi:chitinase
MTEIVPASGQWVLGYYPGYDMTSYPIASIDWSCLTHIAFGPLKANPDGTLNTDFDDNSGKPGQGAKNALALSTAARAHGVKALLMLGGAGEGPHLAQAASGGKTGHRTTLVDALLMAVEALGYDGLDLDWEDAIVDADLLALAQELRGKQPDILLSLSRPGDQLELHVARQGARSAAPLPRQVLRDVLLPGDRSNRDGLGVMVQ